MGIEDILNNPPSRKRAATSNEPIIESSFHGVWTGSDLEELHHRYIDFRNRDGTRSSFDYPDRKLITYLPDLSCIDLEFTGYLVTVTGRNLAPELYELLLERKISWLREADHPEEEDDGDGLYIASIQILREGPEETVDEDSTNSQETPNPTK